MGIDLKKPSKSVELVVDPTGLPAVDLSPIRATGSALLADKAESVHRALATQDANGVRGQVVLLLDFSGSMRYQYSSGNVQTLVDRVLGAGFNFDVDGKIQIFPFASPDQYLPTVEVNAENYTDIVNRELVRKYRMGSTDLTGALKKLRLLTEKYEDPIIAIVITDGEPDSVTSVEQEIKELSTFPVWIKFISLVPSSFLEKLDDLPASQRLVDNVDAKVIPDPAGMTDDEFAAAMVDEFATWCFAAGEAGILFQ